MIFPRRTEYDKNCDTSAWPYLIIRCLRGEISSEELLLAADDTGKKTEAHTYKSLCEGALSAPQWGWGWGGWSDRYRFTRTEFRNLARTEELLREGLSIAGVRDFKAIAERLAWLCEDQGRVDEARELREKAVRHSAEVEQSVEIIPGINVVQLKKSVAFGEEGLPLSEIPKPANLFRASSAIVTGAPVTGGRQKIGRNDPCPCGSGKKFKKCCADDD